MLTGILFSSLSPYFTFELKIKLEHVTNYRSKFGRELRLNYEPASFRRPCNQKRHTNNVAYPSQHRPSEPDHRPWSREIPFGV